MTDFSPGRRVDELLETLLPYHINALQFYDWQYRHDQLVAPSADYQDPLGRSLSLDTVKRLVQFARSRGVGAMAYAAVYAASVDFQRQHPRWALYDATGQPLEFESFLGYMDPTSGRPWSGHLLDQCARAMTEVGFAGIHLDQYGEPRLAFDSDGDEVDLPAAFSNFVADLKRRRPETSATLNAVKNWPMEELSTSREDFYYVELWPDTPSYPEVERVVREARECGNGKQVVVALYVPAEREANVLLVDAMILASGGTRIELGEDRRLLADPYFPNHEQISTELGRALLRYWDTAVRYGDLLFDREVPADSTLEVEGPDGVWTGPYQSHGWLVVALVNFRGLGDARWDRAHPPPDALVDAALRVRGGPAIVSVWWVDPDGQSARPQPLERHVVGLSTVVLIPSLHYWGLLLLEIEHEVET
jgi:dextranase